MRNLNDTPLKDLYAYLTSDGLVDRLLALSRDEDLAGIGDVTTRSIIPAGHPARGAIVLRSGGILCGGRVLPAIVETFGARVTVEPVIADGAACGAHTTVAQVHGHRADVLAVERTMLNVLGHLTSIATTTGAFVDRVEGTGAQICDTRKTTPGWRRLDKYAVRCGGGTLHRMGLYDAALFKDNHLAHIPPADLPAVLAAAIHAARSDRCLRFVEVEVDTIAQLESVLSLEPGLVDMVLLDNMSLEDLRLAVTLRDQIAPKVALEASGSITLDRVRDVAETGMDRISVGALTHSAQPVDLGLDLA